VIAAGLGLSRLPPGDGSFYLVAWEGDEPLGHAHLALTDPPELQDVEVLPAHRRRGVATALTRTAEREVAARGHPVLTLTVGAANEPAQALYRSLGYRDSGSPPQRVQGTVQIRTGPLEVDDTLLTWRKPLAPSALFLHGGPALPDYLETLEDELTGVFEATRYTQGRHVAVDDYVGEALAHMPRSSWLVGHSWGGHLALRVAATVPGRVLGLVLVGSLGAVGDYGLPAALAEIARRAPAARSFEEAWPAYFAGTAPPWPGWPASDGVQVEGTFADILRSDPSEQLRGLDVPVLAIHGSYDHIPIAAVQETLELFPDSELRVLDDAGHFPWLERPGSIREAVVDFLAARSS
jgi:proline iminopeptidase